MLDGHVIVDPCGLITGPVYVDDMDKAERVCLELNQTLRRRVPDVRGDYHRLQKVRVDVDA